MKRVIPTCLAFILFLSMFTVLCPIETIKGDTLHVGTGQTYSTIQAAINDANENDTINVYSGTYTENIVIDKPLTIVGISGRASTTINSGSSSKHTIEITADDVSISGFTIRNLEGSYSCIKLNSVSNCLIKNNIIKYAGDGSGVYLVDSNINTIEDNIIENNYNGLYLSNSDNNIIKINNIQNNENYGIFLASSSTDNTIYLNDFSHISGSNARDLGTNSWDYGTQGNSWDDYNDYDSNSDGIGDNPYVIPGGSNQDNYPLGDFLSPNQQPVAYIDSISPNPATQGQTVNFNGRGVDDGTIVSWEWKSDGVVIATSEDFSTSSLSVGTHTISFRVEDNDGLWSDYKTATLIINPQANQKPTAFILKPTLPTAMYGESVSFQGYGSDPDGTVVAYLWWSDPEGIYSEDISFTKNDLPVGPYTIYLKVRDDDGEWSSEVSTTLTILSDAPENQAPAADADGPYNGYINQSVTFDGSGSHDPDTGDTISYSWDFGDGSTGEGVSPTHNYTSVGEYTVELTVIDNHGEQSKSSTYVNITLKVNGQNGGNGDSNGNDKGIPGFEIVFIIMAIAFLILWKRKRFN